MASTSGRTKIDIRSLAEVWRVLPGLTGFSLSLSISLSRRLCCPFVGTSAFSHKCVVGPHLRQGTESFTADPSSPKLIPIYFLTVSRTDQEPCHGCVRTTCSGSWGQSGGQAPLTDRSVSPATRNPRYSRCQFLSLLSSFYHWRGHMEYGLVGAVQSPLAQLHGWLSHPPPSSCARIPKSFNTKVPSDRIRK